MELLLEEGWLGGAQVAELGGDDAGVHSDILSSSSVYICTVKKRIGHGKIEEDEFLMLQGGLVSQIGDKSN